VSDCSNPSSFEQVNKFSRSAFLPAVTASDDGKSSIQPDLAVLVVSCDAYSDLWSPFFSCLHQFWPDCPYPIYLGSNTKRYEDGRVKTICVGVDRDYSSNLLTMLREIPQQWVLIFVEDVFISSPVDTKRLDEILTVCRKDDIGHFQVLSRHFNQNSVLPHSRCGSFIGIELPIGVPYRVSMSVALWQKETLIEIVQPGESAWELELYGTARSFRSKKRFVLISSKCPPLFKWVHGVVKRKWTREAAAFVRTRKIVIDETYRPVQHFGSHTYAVVYGMARYSFFWVIYRVGGVSAMMRAVSKNAERLKRKSL